MDYETVVTITQSIALTLFIGLFGIVMAYVFWPGNKAKFDRAASLPFEPDGANRKREG